MMQHHPPEACLISIPGCSIEFSTDGEAISIERAIGLMLEIGRQKPGCNVLLWLKIDNGKDSTH